MKICIGDNYGLIKVLNTKNKSIEFKYGSPKLENPTMTIMNNKNNTTISLLRQNDYSIIDYIRQLSIYTFKPDEGTTFISGFNKHSDRGILNTYIAQDNNKIRMFNHNEDSYGEYIIEESTSLSCIELENDKSKAKRIVKISPCSYSQEFYLLYNNLPMRIYDINKNVISFKSKNLPNDELDLQVPIYDTDVCEEIKNQNVFYISTEYGSIRTYDRRAKTRPVNDQSNFTNLPIKKINRMVSVEESYICIGDTTGRVCLLEKRKELLPIKTIARAAGAITDIIYEGNKQILTISKDRYFRIYDYNINDEVCKVYMKHMLNSFCYLSGEDLENDNDEKEGNVEKDENRIEDYKEDEGNDEELDEDDELNDINWDNIGYDQSFDDDEDEDDDEENRELSDKEAKKKGFIVIDRKKKSSKKGKNKKKNK